MKKILVTLCLFFCLFTTLFAEKLYFSEDLSSQNSGNSYLQKDKFAHLTTACFLYCWNYKVMSDICQINSTKCKYLSFSLVNLMGLAKEFVDSKEKNNNFSYKDLMFDLMGSVAGMIICN
ncbi:MAG: hypothetical protein U9P79_06420 [Candidatus Cloacimonadota bacterium]|nr:hypothetical protein [Candidatus Cloacimonadota bacterium]